MPEMKNSRDEFTNRWAEMLLEPSFAEYMNVQPESPQDISAHVLKEKVHSAPVSEANVHEDSASGFPHPHIKSFSAGQGVPATQEGVMYQQMAEDAPKSDCCLEHSLADKGPGALEVQEPPMMEGVQYRWGALYGCCPIAWLFPFCIFNGNDNKANGILACGGGVPWFDISDHPDGVSPTLAPLLPTAE